MHARIQEGGHFEQFLLIVTINSNKSTVIKLGKSTVFRQLYVKHYTVKALIVSLFVFLALQPIVVVFS